MRTPVWIRVYIYNDIKIYYYYNKYYTYFLNYKIPIIIKHRIIHFTQNEVNYALSLAEHSKGPTVVSSSTSLFIASGNCASQIAQGGAFSGVHH